MSEWRPRTSSRNPSTRGSGRSSKPSSTPSSVFGNHFARPPVARTRKLRSQYPLDSDEPHVEYILVASFHVDKGPIMEHQYPAPISGDEHMLAELMLPDQAHVRKQDWTIFFLHKDNGGEDEKDDYSGGKQTAGGEEDHPSIEQDPDVTEEERKEEERQKLEDAMGGSEGPPLIYVLNLVNTKQDPTVKRGAVVKAMAICTRHSFLHIYKPLLLLALDEYFKSPRLETLASLYDAVNSMDLSLMPRLSLLERIILQASDSKDMFIEKFEQMIQQRMAGESKSPLPPSSPDSPSKSTTDLTRMVGGHRYTLPRDTHEYETRVIYNGIPIPVKVPTAVSPETVGDFSLIKLIQTFAGPHSTSPQPFMLHSHLTTAGAYTHPIIVLMNAMLTQKRVIFIGHNRPSGEVAEAVLAACALASGGILKGFTRHAFPYTDLTKIDALLKVPGFIAGVTNPAFANHPEWWDLLCDIPTGRMKISSRIAPAPVTEGLVYFNQQISLSANNVGSPSTNNPSDPVGDQAFMDDVLRSIANRYGEANIRARWRDWVVRFTRMAAVFEEIVYGASALYIGGDVADAGAAGVSGHGYVWSDDAARQRELSGAVSRIEGWRNTRSYYSFIQDLAQFYTCCPISQIDLHHHHDRLRSRKLTHNESAAIYFAFNSTVHSYAEICQLLTLAPESHAGLFYLSLGLFHPEGEVRVKTAELLERIMEHDAGRHFWASLSRFAKLAFLRIRKSREAAERKRVESNPGFAMRS
ncbi:spindle pole body interacting protein [Xylona heveae TC161]|uniref:Spindle pole body interacting protein n=1 Tax=Xylona heveae (strain CBS 132557 / TC161) TaxID=1328760 RepID=A0A165ILM3_XYLHT|nr:spindle pole body interacting protein [Xylona heveae TC161]KZF25072.1 spindle pole body interacting protein [Xylona heveae TC161]